MPDDAYRELKRQSVVDALAAQGLVAAEVASVVAAQPASRRRASLKLAKSDGRTLLGFHARRSHEIVDMQECRVLTPELQRFVVGLRGEMGPLLKDGESLDMFVTETIHGPDLALNWKRGSTPALVGQIAKLAKALRLSRVTANGEILVELAEPMVRIGRAEVRLPHECFLQATEEGEAALQARVLAAANGAKNVADLFSGCGTFALVLAEKARVHAVDGDKPALEALALGARKTQGLKPVTIETRDLFKLPLSATEIARFDTVVLDPPRAGAAAQVAILSRTKTPRIVYASCNLDSFARDARVLVAAGWRLGTVTPIDQFLWSSHIELVAAFTRT